MNEQPWGWRDRVAFGVAGLLIVAAISAIVPGWPAIGRWLSDAAAPAWVQALGSVGAILVAILIAAAQDERQRRDRINARADRLYEVFAPSLALAERAARGLVFEHRVLLGVRKYAVTVPESVELTCQEITRDMCGLNALVLPTIQAMGLVREIKRQSVFGCDVLRAMVLRKSLTFPTSSEQSELLMKAVAELRLAKLRLRAELFRLTSGE